MWITSASAQKPRQLEGGRDVFAPSFWDIGRRLPRPDLSAVTNIRFLTEDDYPPFNFIGPDGVLIGFNVDLARALCEELHVTCTVQTRAWDRLTAALDENLGDAIIASLAMSPHMRAKVDFTAPYYRTPARFVIRASKTTSATGAPDKETGVSEEAMPAEEATPEKMAGRKIGVLAQSAHEAWLRIYFPKAALVTFATPDEQRAALISGAIDALFGDAISLSAWLNQTRGAECCRFFGGPFLDNRYFGEGVGIAVRKNNASLRRALDYALSRLAERGVYSELYLKYFPVGPF